MKCAQSKISRKRFISNKFQLKNTNQSYQLDDDQRFSMPRNQNNGFSNNFLLDFIPMATVNFFQIIKISIAIVFKWTRSKNHLHFWTFCFKFFNFYCKDLLSAWLFLEYFLPHCYLFDFFQFTQKENFFCFRRFWKRKKRRLAFLQRPHKKFETS